MVGNKVPYICTFIGHFTKCRIKNMYDTVLVPYRTVSYRYFTIRYYTYHAYDTVHRCAVEIPNEILNIGIPRNSKVYIGISQAPQEC